MGERKGQSKLPHQVFLSIGVCLRFVPLVYRNIQKESKRDTDPQTYAHIKKKMSRPKIQNQKLNYYKM